MTDHIPSNFRGDEGGSDLSGDIIVRMKSRDVSDREREALFSGSPASVFNDFVNRYGVSRPTPVITSLQPDEIDEMEGEAAERLHPPMFSLNLYWRVDAEATEENAEQRVAELRRLPGVEYAYPELAATDPQAQAGDEYQPRQTYLGADFGIDAEFLWTTHKCTGQGVAVADIEESWNVDHVDLPPTRPQLLCGKNFYSTNPFGADHGTGVLGVLVAAHNGMGVAGIAPDATPALASRSEAATSLHPREIRTGVANAIYAAAKALDRGTVLLIEVQRGTALPSEVDETTYNAIRTAVGMGMVVVEPAGNAERDLATYVNPKADTEVMKHPFTCDKPECLSGAIMVGAATPRNHDRISSNYGKRVDCFAHGAAVVTTGGGDLGKPKAAANQKYTARFDGTSAAAAIIAGAAVLVQARHKALHEKPLPPHEVRRMLSDCKTGTPSGSPGDIGVMPNLRKIVEANPCLQDTANPLCS